MKEQSDKTFIRNFSLIVVVLILFTVAIVFLAKTVGFKEDQDVPSRAGLTEERIRPVADVYTEVSGAEVAQETAAQEAVTQDAVVPEAVVQETVAEAAPVQTVTAEGDLDGEKIYASACAACHATGTVGAPIPGSAEMAQRAESGLDAMLQNSLNGLNAMPARGGRPDLSDEQVKAVVEFMLK